jgi:hypothetical protein
LTEFRKRHTRILPVPEAEALLNSWLEAIHIEQHSQPRELILDYQELQLSASPRLSWRNDRPWEHLEGFTAPRRLRFRDLSMIECTGLFTHLAETPGDHPIRRMYGLIHFLSDKGIDLYFMLHSADEPARLMFSAGEWNVEERSGLPLPVIMDRDWSPAPPLPIRLVPNPVNLHSRFGGDPITIHLGKRSFHQHLFVGGLDLQSELRPQMDAVLNLSENSNPWVETQGQHTADRWACKGEGAYGMEIGVIQEEAQWVIDRLLKGERVLVHCQAGFNRSPTICCAVLILLEALSAEEALERVREHRPWARPDSHHWLALKWLALHM